MWLPRTYSMLMVTFTYNRQCQDGYWSGHQLLGRAPRAIQAHRAGHSFTLLHLRLRGHRPTRARTPRIAMRTRSPCYSEGQPPRSPPFQSTILRHQQTITLNFAWSISNFSGATRRTRSLLSFMLPTRYVVLPAVMFFSSAWHLLELH